MHLIEKTFDFYDKELLQAFADNAGIAVLTVI